MTESHVQTVLIVESSVQDRSRYRGFLGSRTGQAYGIIEAETVHAALHLCKSQRLDCVLVGSKLSDGHPTHLLRSLKSDPALKKLPVVMMLSEKELPEATQKAFLDGAIDCVSENVRCEEQLIRATHNAMQIAEITRLVTQETTLRARAEVSLQKRGLPLPKEGTRHCPRGLLFLLDISGSFIGANQAASRWLEAQWTSAKTQKPWELPFSVESPANLSHLTAQCLRDGHAQGAGALAGSDARLYPVTLFFDRIDREKPEDAQIAVTLADRASALRGSQVSERAPSENLAQADLLMARAHAAIEALVEVLSGAEATASSNHDSVSAVHSLLERLPAALLVPVSAQLRRVPEHIVPK